MDVVLVVNIKRLQSTYRNNIKINGRGLNSKQINNLTSSLNNFVPYAIKYFADYLQNNLKRQAPRASGKLRSAIKTQVRGDKIYIINAPRYVKQVVEGRDEITAPPNESLRIKINGRVLYVKHVSGTKANDFITRAFNITKSNADDIAIKALAKAVRDR